MAIKDLLTSGAANVSITVSADDLRVFFAEVAQQVINQEKAAEAQHYDVTMTQKEVCDYLGVSKATLWRWEKIGYLIPSTRMGARPMYRKSVVEQLKKGA